MFRVRKILFKLVYSVWREKTTPLKLKHNVWREENIFKIRIQCLELGKRI